ncbi:MAG: hypothetical protein IPJ98_09285 [Bryobacterales bacterium]|nr:hypothetical protein [Bryobacterales bacterium]
MIFLHAAARRASPSGACLALAEQGLLELYVSPAILAEVQDVISRPRIRAKFPQLTDAVVAEFIAIERHLNLAAECQAEYLVSRDRDLLDGADAIAIRLPRLRIVDPVTFLVELRAQLESNS